MYIYEPLIGQNTPINVSQNAMIYLTLITRISCIGNHTCCISASS